MPGPLAATLFVAFALLAIAVVVGVIVWAHWAGRELSAARASWLDGLMESERRLAEARRLHFERSRLISRAKQRSISLQRLTMRRNRRAKG